MSRFNAQFGPTFYDTVAAGAAVKQNEYLSRLQGYPANAATRSYVRSRQQSQTREQAAMALEAMANAAPEVSAPQTIINPYVQQPQELPRANPAAAGDEPEGRTSTGLGVSQRAAPWPADLRVPRGSTNQASNALAAKAALESQERRRIAYEERNRRNEQTDRIWSRYMDAAFDPSNPIDERAIGELSKQFMEEYGLPSQAPNPVRLLGVNIEDDDPNVALASARDQAAQDARNPGGYESRIRLGKDGNVDYSAYDERLKLDLEDQRERRSLYHELLKTEMEGLEKMYRLDAAPDPTDPASKVEYRQRQLDFARESAQLRSELQKNVLGIDPVAGLPGASVSAPEGTGAAPSASGPSPAVRGDFRLQNGVPVIEDGLAYKRAFDNGQLIPGQQVYYNGSILYVHPDGKVRSNPPGGLRGN